MIGGLWKLLLGGYSSGRQTIQVKLKSRLTEHYIRSRKFGF